MAEVDLDSDEIYPLGWGLVFKGVCAPKGLSDDEISDRVTASDPPGTSANRWVCTTSMESLELAGWIDQTGDTTGRIQCPDHEGREHVLMNC